MTEPAVNPLLDPIDEQSPELYREAMQTLRIGFLLAAVLFVIGYLAVELSSSEFSPQGHADRSDPRCVARW
ncbi:MAG: hypothetical protein R2839_03160 [Thermomicrobiales bacterium]